MKKIIISVLLAFGFSLATTGIADLIHMLESNASSNVSTSGAMHDVGLPEPPPPPPPMNNSVSR